MSNFVSTSNNDVFIDNLPEEVNPQEPMGIDSNYSPSEATVIEPKSDKIDEKTVVKPGTSGEVSTTEKFETIAGSSQINTSTVVKEKHESESSEKEGSYKIIESNIPIELVSYQNQNIDDNKLQYISKKKQEPGQEEDSMNDEEDPSRSIPTQTGIQYVESVPPLSRTASTLSSNYTKSSDYPITTTSTSTDLFKFSKLETFTPTATSWRFLMSKHSTDATSEAANSSILGSFDNESSPKHENQETLNDSISESANEELPHSTADSEISMPGGSLGSPATVVPATRAENEPLKEDDDLEYKIDNPFTTLLQNETSKNVENSEDKSSKRKGCCTVT